MKKKEILKAKNKKLFEILKEYDKDIEYCNSLIEEAKTNVKKKIKDIKNIITKDDINQFWYETNYPIYFLSEAYELQQHKFTNKYVDREYVYQYNCPLCKQETKTILGGNYRNRENIMNDVIKPCYRCDFNLERLQKSITYGEIQKFKYMKYYDYLQTPYWKLFADRAKENSGHKCQLCNSHESLNVHHKTYDNRGKETFEDIIVLCRNCHAKFHDKVINM